MFCNKKQRCTVLPINDVETVLKTYFFIMKKLFITFICITLFGQVARAHDLDNLLKKVSQAENVESIKIEGFMLWLGKKMGGSRDLPSSLKNINKIEIHDLSNCQNSLKQEINTAIKEIKYSGTYEILAQVKNKGELLKIYIRKEKGSIKEFLVLTSENDTPSIIRVHGNINEKDLATLMSNYNS